MASFDVIILGGGPAGYICAIRSAQLGLSTAVVEQDKLGGVCVNIGCIPTKALLHSAYIASLLKESKDFGVEASGVKTDYGVAMKRSRRVSDQNSKGVEFLMKKHKITVIKGTGVVQPGKKVKVGSDVHDAKKAVVIATGSRVKGIPQIGLEISGGMICMFVTRACVPQANNNEANEPAVKFRARDSSQARRFFSHALRIVLQLLLKLLRHCNLLARGTQLFTDVLKFRDVVDQDSITRPLKGFARALHCYKRITVAIATYPRTEGKDLGHVVGAQFETIDRAERIANFDVQAWQALEN